MRMLVDRSNFNTVRRVLRSGSNSSALREEINQETTACKTCADRLLLCRFIMKFAYNNSSVGESMIPSSQSLRISAVDSREKRFKAMGSEFTTSRLRFPSRF